MLAFCLLLRGDHAFADYPSAEDMERASIPVVTDDLIKEGYNQAGLIFANCANTEEEPFVTALLETYGLLSANLFVTAPKGTTNFLTGQENQLPGNDTGATFNVPLDVSRPQRAAIGVNQFLAFTPDNVGDNVFNAMVTHLKNLYDEYSKNGNTNTLEQFYQEGEENPVFYLTYTPDVFLAKFGISIMSDYTGTVTDVSKLFQFGIIYSEERFASGNIDIVYGIMLVDSASEDGNSWIDATGVIYPDTFYPWLFIYDGARDKTIKFSFWLAKEAEEDASKSGGGGCEMGIGPFAVLALVSTLVIAMSSRKKSPRGI
jgi:hypothetical protein